MSDRLPKVIAAPEWLKERWRKIREHNRLHPPTLEEVRAQFEASANQKDSIQKELDDCIKRGKPIR